MSFFILNQFRKSFYPQKRRDMAEDIPELLLNGFFLCKRSEREPVQFFHVIFYRIRQADTALKD